MPDKLIVFPHWLSLSRTSRNQEETTLSAPGRGWPIFGWSGSCCLAARPRRDSFLRLKYHANTRRDFGRKKLKRYLLPSFFVFCLIALLAESAAAQRRLDPASPAEGQFLRLNQRNVCYRAFASQKVLAGNYRRTSKGILWINRVYQLRQALRRLKTSRTDKNYANTLKQLQRVRRRIIPECRKLFEQSAEQQPKGVFLSAAALQRLKRRVANQEQPFYSNYRVSQGKAAAAHQTNPFYMSDIKAIGYGWCEPVDDIDDTLRELNKKLETQSDRIRAAALAFAVTGEKTYGDKASAGLLDWARNSRTVNIYDFHPNFQTAQIDGQTAGACSFRPWNFALDAMWQTYGLINMADAYTLLTRNGYQLSQDADSLMRGFILQLIQNVNSSFHAWTRWADYHPNSPSYQRYRSDNHLSWCLAGLLAGAVALGDQHLAQYVLNGGAWYDAKAGINYANPSHMRDVIDRAIESGTGAQNEGRIYEEKILRNPPIGYALFHLWPMALVAHMAEIHFNQNIWDFTGADRAGLYLAFKRYAAFVLGERPSPRPEQEGDLSWHSWLWEFAYAAWRTERFKEVVKSKDRSQFINQSIGSISAVVGEDIN